MITIIYTGKQDICCKQSIFQQ